MSNILKSKNIFLYITIALVAVFTVFYFVLVNKVSYAFETSDSLLYDSKIAMIEETAKAYAEYNPDVFGEDDFVYFTVGELVEKGAIVPDNENGDVKDPNGEVKTLNDLKIRVEKKDGKISAEVLN